jgi:hypothetical protein
VADGTTQGEEAAAKGVVGCEIRCEGFVGERDARTSALALKEACEVTEVLTLRKFPWAR